MQMRTYNVQAIRHSVSGSWKSSEQLPQFDVQATSGPEACAKAREILGNFRPVAWASGTVTDGDTVWDLVSAIAIAIPLGDA